MELTVKQIFRISKIQKKTLAKLNDKYHINTSQFIRDAIKEKLTKDMSKIKEVKKYLKEENYTPF